VSDNRGISSLGLCHPLYDVKKFIGSFKNASIIRFGWLDNFFNPQNSKHAIQVMKLNRSKFCRVHIINGPGMNNGRPQSHEITRGMDHAECVSAIKRKDAKFLQAFRKRVLHVADVVRWAPAGTLELAVSPWLEHQPIPQEVFETLAGIIREILPQAAIVDNPVTGGFVPGGYLREFHGVNAPRGVDIADLDGIDWEAADLKAYAKRHETAKCCYIWGFRDNGLTAKSSWAPPQKRKDFPRKREQRVYRLWTSPHTFRSTSPLNPIDTKGKRILDPYDGAKSGFVWKLGEDKDFATCLLPRDAEATKLWIEKDGKRIADARFRSRYTHDNSQRQIWDFRTHPADLPNNVVLTDGRKGWVLEFPAFRID